MVKTTQKGETIRAEESEGVKVKASEDVKVKKREHKVKESRDENKSSEDKSSDLPLVLLNKEMLPEYMEALRKVCNVVYWLDVFDLADQPVDKSKTQHKTDIDRNEIVGLFTYGHTKVNTGILEALPSLRVISNFGVGYDHIDAKAARDHGVPVGHTPGVLSAACADLAFGLLIAVARNLIPGAQFAHDKNTKAFTTWLGTEVSGATLGIIGFGRIGVEIARRGALGFGMKVLYHSRHPTTNNETFGAIYCAEVKDLLQQADFVVLSMPYTTQTRHFMNAQSLSWMKKSAFLINVARGGVVDQDALVKALNSGVIAGAGLDVTEPEPLPRDHPLLTAKNVVILPHFGSATTTTRKKMFDLALSNLVAGLEGNLLPASVPETTGMMAKF